MTSEIGRQNAKTPEEGEEIRVSALGDAGRRGNDDYKRSTSPVFSVYFVADVLVCTVA